jgi:hypothetical protein
LEDKINLVSGKLVVDDFGNVPVLPDGLPILALADGPAGRRLANPTLPDHKATALPAPLLWPPRGIQTSPGDMGMYLAQRLPPPGTTSCSARQSILLVRRLVGRRSPLA